ncbi:GSCOCG00008176001-RA-CDS [Cotesia congregata]|uniref:Motile sperm domain-containing protein 3 n=1 Tax=Cotesia congregata TaxID=51543 RepID=A0A8J2HRB0_COTCN|nr:GSCOCG00008176001-RA-CDS [Cotesia congregata]CAG5107829.1 Similar to Mospd1: Motile sperm domain-containing protein 1 (Mus musculus) [Cotesia congregata]
MHSSRTPRKFPVFVFPQSITFYLDDQSTHKQVLTLYNPYEFPVKFKVLSTAPNKYKVVDPEGTIKSRCCVDIVVRHTALLAANCNVVDKFRIQMQEHPTKQVIGKRDVEAKLLSGVSDPGRRTPDPEMFQQLPLNETRQQRNYSLASQARTIERGTNYIALIAGIVCIIGLLLPTEGEQSLSIPEYLYLSVNFKLILSFVLGLVTIIILRL